MSGAFWQGSGAALLAADPEAIVDRLARVQITRFRQTEAAQESVWRESLDALRAALTAMGPAAADWGVALEYPMLRLGQRIDAVVLTDRAILVLEFKRAAAGPEAFRQVDDYALNLRDFQAASRRHPIVPVLVSAGAAAPWPAPLFWHGVVPVHGVAPERLAALLRAVQDTVPAPAEALDWRAWLAAPYAPVPTIIEAARMSYARHGVADIAAARADRRNLGATTAALAAHLAAARAAGCKVALFVTGIPGAGKTLAGLNLVFGELGEEATFLTGNPALVHVLRAALLRDAVARGREARQAAREIAGRIQELPKFRTHALTHPDHRPAERIAVIDEAQRCWDAAHAARKTRDKPIRLTDSEPGLLLDIMGRHAGFAAVVCLIGSGQEIHDGEGGLAEWGRALRARPGWRLAAPPAVTGHGDARWHLGEVAGALADPALHLDVAVRQIRAVAASAWVEAVLAGDAPAARRIAAAEAGGVPFQVTRDLAAARAAARALCRGYRRAGLVGSASGRRLRAVGLGAELPHMDAAAVARFFLDRYPADVRASDALEQVATEFSVQGLELDVVVLAWDLDLRRIPGRAAWGARRFVGTKWQMANGEGAANRLNTYRVLLTRARYETIIYVPVGDAADGTRPPADYDAIADFLIACGAPRLEAVPVAPAHAAAELTPAQGILV